MSRLQVIVLVLSVSFIFSCKQMVTFDQAQPVGSRNLDHFPLRIQGEFVSAADSSILLIGDEMIVRSYEISGSVMVHAFQKYVDTMFILGKYDVLRKMKGYYFLNHYIENVGWEVQKLQIRKGVLSLSRISIDNELENLSDLTDSPLDTVPPLSISATRQEFKAFVKDAGFTSTQVFIKR